jgi:hypothetical protein
VIFHLSFYQYVSFVCICVQNRSLGASNRRLVRNAIANVCLAGSSLRDKNHRRKVLSHLDSPEWASTGRFCIAFRDSLGFRHDFRALYAFQRDSSFGFILFQLCVWVMDVCVAQQKNSIVCTF